jgi:hypothetical protein
MQVFKLGRVDSSSTPLSYVIDGIQRGHSAFNKSNGYKNRSSKVSKRKKKKKKRERKKGKRREKQE